MENNSSLNASIFIIFGAGGDLTWRKLMPALYNLFLDNSLPEKFEIFGLGLEDMNDDKFRAHLRKGVDQFSSRGKAKSDAWKSFAEHLHFEQADLTRCQSV